MKLNKLLLLAFALLAITSCSKNEDETLNPNKNYTEIQQKALNILNGTWISNEITEKYYMSGATASVTAVPADTLVFKSQYPAPKTFLAYDYLQGKEVENFIVCGTCELKSGRSIINAKYATDCYFYITPSGNALHLYSVESERLVKSYDFRIESDSRFYAGAYYGIPIIFNKQ